MISFLQDEDDFMDGQESTMIKLEPANNIETEIDNKKSDEQSHQFIESAETENPVDDLLQESQHQLIEIDQQQYPTVEDTTVETIIQVRQLSQLQQLQSPQQQQRASSNIQIKMVDMYKQQEQLEQLVINKIEVQDIALVEDYKFSYDTLDLKQMYDDKVQKFDTFRGGTKFIFNPRPIIFSESDDKTINRGNYVRRADSKAISAQVSRQHERQS